MIIGGGDIASVIPDRADRIYFASGVSNSREEREWPYKMEMKLLLSQPKDKRLVYFSSLCVFYSQNRYAQHKRFMENLIKIHFPYYCIFRLGNITWGKNPNTIINYLRNKIISGDPYKVKDEYRYLVDKNEFLYWLGMIPEFNCEMNITGQRVKVAQIVEEIKQGKL